MEDGEREGRRQCDGAGVERSRVELLRPGVFFLNCLWFEKPVVVGEELGIGRSFVHSFIRRILAYARRLRRTRARSLGKQPSLAWAFTMGGEPGSRIWEGWRKLCGLLYTVLMAAPDHVG